VTSSLEKRAQAFEKIAQSQAIADLKQTMNKFSNQLNDLAANVESWWRWVMEILAGLSVDETTQY
jgi:prefoldin subunit 5